MSNTVSKKPRNPRNEFRGWRTRSNVGWRCVVVHRLQKIVLVAQPLNVYRLRNHIDIRQGFFMTDVQLSVDLETQVAFILAPETFSWADPVFITLNGAESSLPISSRFSPTVELIVPENFVNMIPRLHHVLKKMQHVRYMLLCKLVVFWGRLALLPTDILRVVNGEEVYLIKDTLYRQCSKPRLEPDIKKPTLNLQILT